MADPGEPSDKDRDRAFKAERNRQMLRMTAIQRDTAAEITRQLEAARTSINAVLAGQPTDYQLWRLKLLRDKVDAILGDAGDGMSSAIGGAADQSWNAGIDLVDKPIDAGMSVGAPPGTASIFAAAPAIDAGQLDAMRTFMTDKMKSVTLGVANKVNAELAQVVIGVRNVGEAIDSVGALIGGGRKRAIMVVRTELGRAYSTAAQERKAQAAKVLPGLKKQWRRSGKLHSRPAHDAADGQLAAVDQPYTVDGVKLLYPRDPAAPAKETVNCGCLSLPFMDRWNMSQPGRQPFSDRELAASPIKRALASGLDAAPTPVSSLTGPDGQAARASLINSLSTNDPAVAKAKIAGLVHDASFHTFLQGNEAGDFPVGVLPAALRDAFGTDATVLRLSQYTTIKQGKHPDITPADYAALQDMLDRGEVLEDGPNHLLVRSQSGKSRYAVIKATADRQELYLQSLYATNPVQIARRRRGRTVIRKE